MEYLLVIRFFGLLIIAFYVYIKILNITPISKLKVIAALLFSMIMSIPLSYAPPFYELIFLGSFSLFVSLIARVKLPLLVTAVMISTAISLGIEVLSHTIITLPLWVFFSDSYWNSTILIISQSIVSIVSAIMIYCLFRLKRLKKGFPFLKNKQAQWIGINLSLILMLGRSIPGAAGYEWILVGFLIHICTMAIYFWWRYHTTMLYQQRIKEREIEKCMTEIKALSESNDFLSKVVHRDNKLIPAMYHAVDHSLSNPMKSKALLNDLEETIQERTGMILKFQRTNKSLPSTQIERIDNILNYMLAKATENDIEFDFVLIGKIKDIAIPKQRLDTLLADLIENAMIATSYSTYKKILVTMGCVDGYLEITIQDSGIPFEAEILAHLGVKKSTTHADTGGSGIGYVTIFEILNENKASFSITEYPPEEYGFSKSIKVRFDGKSKRLPV